MTDEQRHRPFSNGSQADDWESANCERCTKGYDEAATTFRCDMQEALALAFWDDGTVSLDIATRMGALPDDGPPFRYCWQCPEVVWTDAWQAECRRRYPERFSESDEPTPDERIAAGQLALSIR